MRRAIGVILTFALLFPAAYVARDRAGASLNALLGDRPPGATTAPAPAAPPQPPVSALTGSLALVVVGGLTEEMSWRIPALQYLRSRGAAGVLWAEKPTLGPAAWATMLTGLPAGKHRVIVMGQLARPLAPDNVLRRARRAGLITAVAAPPAWERWLEADASYFTRLDDAGGLAGSVWSKQPNLFVAYLPDLDRAGHAHPVGSSAYLDALGRVGTGLFEWLETVDLNRTTVIVVGDHGMREDGGHGGDEPEVARVPLIAAGRGIAPGRPEPAPQRDVEPMIAGLLGLAASEPNRAPPGYLKESQSAALPPRRAEGSRSAGDDGPYGLLDLLNDPGVRSRAGVAAGTAGAALLALALAVGTGPWARPARAGLVTFAVSLLAVRLALHDVGPFARIGLGLSLSDIDPHSPAAAIGKQWAFEMALAVLAGATVAAVRAARLDRPPGAAVAALCAALAAFGALLAAPGYLADGLVYDSRLPSPGRLLALHGGLLLVQVAAGLCPAWMAIGARAAAIARRPAAGEAEAQAAKAKRTETG